tara:strand:- start:231 stop:602 length:372 start_codon:yes stop_codon:yes gene_type:complete
MIYYTLMPLDAYEIAIGQSHAALNADEKNALYARIGHHCEREAAFRRICQQMYPRVSNRAANLYYEHTYVLDNMDSVFHLLHTARVQVPPRQRVSFRNAAIRHHVLAQYAAQNRWKTVRRSIF